MFVIKPKQLSKGDCIALVTVSAPEAGMNLEQFQRGVRSIEDVGYKIVIGKSALLKGRDYLAGTDKQRAYDVNQAFENPDVGAIICTGGGTNANRILPLLDYETIASNPKIFMGMSNPSILLNAINTKTGLITFHGPVVVWNFGAENGLPSYTEKHMKLLIDPRPFGEVERKPDWKFLKPGKATGRLLGGNLWSIESLLGTEYEPDWNGAILFWEDILKEPRRIDAMLMHFKLAGVFDKISGMVVGRLVACDPKEDAENPYTTEEILSDLLHEHNFPILVNVDLGHTDDKITIPVGAKASIDSERGTFTIDEAVVRSF